MLEKKLIQHLEDPEVHEWGIDAAVLRLDTLHPVVSGNKIFKLKHYLKEAIRLQKQSIISFGGAFSNHLVATAFAAKENNMLSIGFVRGEAPQNLSDSLMECKEYGMQLNYLSRTSFDKIDLESFSAAHPDSMVIPHGGYGKLGVEGAKEIMEIPGVEKFDTIMAACGTGTMAAGLLSGLAAHQQLLLVSVLKNNFSIVDEVDQLLRHVENKSRRVEYAFDHHAGGYAKQNKALLETMNHFYAMHGIPTDFVYTGKLVHAFYSMLRAGKFKAGSKLLLIHSGGLQGNRSLKNNELKF